MDEKGGGRLYFAYGSNMNRQQMGRRCPKASLLGIGRLPNFEFRINRQGVATIAPREGGEVYGVLWYITPSDERSLDRYEGVPEAYSKETVRVLNEAGVEVQALTYIATDPSPGRPRSREYLKRILEGAEENGLPPAYIEELRRWWPHNW